MTIHLISFASILHKQVSLRSSHEAILSEIEKYYTVKFVDHQDMDKLSSDDFKIIFGFMIFVIYVAGFLTGHINCWLLIGRSTMIPTFS